MLRKIISNRSGFSIAEIVVAFAIFSIMAAMVGQLLNLTTRAKQQNNDYSRYLAAQEEQLAKVTKDQLEYKTGDDAKDLPGGTVSLQFGDPADADHSATVIMPYQTKGAGDVLDAKYNGKYYDDMTGTGADLNDFDSSEEGLNLFIADVDYTPELTIKGGGGGGGGGASTSDSVISRMNTRIAGTKGFEGIYLWDVRKDTHTYAAGDPFKPKGTRYFIECSANGNPVTPEDIVFAQYRLFFYYDMSPSGGDPSVAATEEEIEIKDESGTVTDKYTKKSPTAAPIIDAGYISEPSISSISGLTSSNTKSLDTPIGSVSNQTYVVRKSYNSVEICTPFSGGYYNPKYGTGGDGKIGGGNFGTMFDKSKHTCFYVDFEYDPYLTIQSFGKNGTTYTGYCKYEACPRWNDEGVYTPLPTEILAHDADPYNSYKKIDTDSNSQPLHYTNIYGAYLKAKYKSSTP